MENETNEILKRKRRNKKKNLDSDNTLTRKKCDISVEYKVLCLLRDFKFESCIHFFNLFLR